MTASYLDTALRELRVESFIQTARSTSLARAVASRLTDGIRQESPNRLPRLAYVYECQGLEVYTEAIETRRTGEEVQPARLAFENASECWEAMLSLPIDKETLSSQKSISSTGLDIVQEEINDDPLTGQLFLAFHVAASGLLSRAPAKTCLTLRRFTLPVPSDEDDWQQRVLRDVAAAFVMLVRKDEGWSDIDNALYFIQRLRKNQSAHEDAHLDAIVGQEEQAKEAVRLVGQYHLAQIITLTGEYLSTGNPPFSRMSMQLQRHRDRAMEAFSISGGATYAHFCRLLWAGSHELCFNSIWTHMTGLGEKVLDFAKHLADHSRAKPVIELWPGQQDALRSNLLDPYRRAVLVEMPTSAGKTLLAKFSIVQARALNPTATIAYVVPTRALVNQITSELRSDFREIGWSVEQAVPSFELNPTESMLLSSRPAILVTTPEKLDLLVKGDHPATRDLSLVIADEAHNIGESGTRGARLELLLGTIKRERPNVRFLLLSPFLPNDGELVRWLGEDRALPPIKLSWRPSRRMVGAVTVCGQGRSKATCFKSFPAASNTDISEEIEFPIGPPAKGTSIKALSKSAVEALLDKGSMLILCRGRGTAMTRAGEMASSLPKVPQSDFIGAVCRYIEAEVGGHSVLSDSIQHGVAYHHSGLSHETRWLVERLIAKGIVNVVCGTTTLAQGMNFPIRTVVIETLKKGNEANLTYQDFWNIAGRAGRALMDTTGIVAFPVRNRKDDDKYREFLRGEAEEISSQLAELLSQADHIAERFDLATVRRWPQMAELMRFLAHAMRTAGGNDIADEVEDILRSSLVYYQARRESEDAAARLVALCRGYLSSLQGKGTGILSLADKTGFATPSVLALLAKSHQTPELTDAMQWQPRILFGQDIEPLTQRVAVVAEMPEMKLSDGERGPFNPERVAKILRDWVAGESLTEMANRYSLGTETNIDRKVADFGQFLFSNLLGQASWGIGALESVCLADQDENSIDDAAYIPSMLFFGVRSREGVWMRMAGVPRVVADGLGRLWPSQVDAPRTYQDLRSWVSTLTDTQWQKAIPSGTALTPQDMRILWKELG